MSRRTHHQRSGIMREAHIICPARGKHHGKKSIAAAMLFLLAPPVGLEPTTHGLTGDRGKIPLFPLPPNSPILLGFLDSVGIMEMRNFHYFRAFQKNEEQNQVRGSLSFFAPETYDIFCFSRRLQLQ